MARSNGTMLLRKLMFVALIGMFAFTAFAQFGGGEGTEDNPWEISRAAHLHNIREENHLAGFFIQTADIDVSPDVVGDEEWYDNQGGWLPIETFRGTYDGGGFTITGLTANRGDSNRQSLFGIVSGGIVKNVHLVDASLTGRRDVGALVGTLDNNSLVLDCSASGSVTSPGEWIQGGLVGRAVGSRIENSSARVNVSSARGRAGGLVGWLNNSHIVNCYATGSVTSPANIGVNGGLVGLLNTGTPSISNSYATGAVTVGSNQGGGLVGTISHGTVSHSYATGLVTGTGGGLVGQGPANSVSESYWDVETTGKETSTGGGTGLLTRQMIYPYDAQEAFVRWDFEEIWREDSEFVNEENPGVNNGYPYLFYQEGDEQEPLETPIVRIERVIEEDIEIIRLSWEAVEGAQSYRIYASEIPEAEEWGDPIDTIADTDYEEGFEDSRTRFFKVVASPAEIDD